MLIYGTENCCRCYIFMLRISLHRWQKTQVSLGRYCPRLCWPEEMSEKTAASSSLHASHCLTVWGEWLMVICISVKLRVNLLTQFPFAEDNCLLCSPGWPGYHPAISWIPPSLTLPCPALHHLSHFIPQQPASFRSIHINSPHKLWVFPRPQNH